MNLLEHYIMEVYSVEIVTKDSGSFVKVDLKVGCYGITERKLEIFPTMEEWENSKKLGYYMA